MKKIIANTRSKCCNSKVIIRCSPDDIDKIGCTMYYVCLACGKTCDVFYTQRKIWKINPSTRIKGDERGKIKEKQIKKEIKENS